MKLGVFDSGMGGLIITRALIGALPQYDYVYLGDSARMPYGNRSAELIYRFTRDGIKYLFDQGCGLVIVACNTAAAEALRRIQREFLPKYYPDRQVIGVLKPAAEAAAAATKTGRIGVLATQGTVASRAFVAEITKLRPDTEVLQQAAPLLVPLIEYDGREWARPVASAYLKRILKEGIDTLILGCTHYPAYKDIFREIAGPNVAVISQDEVVPPKLVAYLTRHPEIETKLSRQGGRQFLVTDITVGAQKLAERLGVSDYELKRVVYT